jgi:hypothetical protein
MGSRRSAPQWVIIQLRQQRILRFDSGFVSDWQKCGLIFMFPLKMSKYIANRYLILFFIILAIAPAWSRADDDDERGPATAPAGSAIQPGETQFGLFGLLDKRSKYYSDFFPEPFRVEDTTLDNEMRLDWQHNEGRVPSSNQFIAEVQKAVGIVTFEVQGTYIIDRGGPDAGNVLKDVGDFGNIELGARVPVYQVVSGDFDNSVGVNFELGVPTNSRLSKNTEITPGVFDDLRIGDHITMQSLFSLSSLLGSEPDEARESFEYGLAFGYSVEDEQFALPHVERIVPLFELVGETGLSGHDSGHNALTATAGVRVELKPIWGLQPQLGVGYIFPIDQGGREQLRWGMFTSVVFDF